MESDKCNFKSHVVLMKGITWSRDSHGLFDYESRHLTKKTMKTNGPSQIIRKNNDLDLNGYENTIPYVVATDDLENKPLLNIVNENDVFYLASCSEPQTKMESKDLNE
jgi:hypothetical protein